MLSALSENLILRDAPEHDLGGGGTVTVNAFQIILLAFAVRLALPGSNRQIIMNIFFLVFLFQLKPRETI